MPFRRLVLAARAAGCLLFFSSRLLAQQAAPSAGHTLVISQETHLKLRVREVAELPSEERCVLPAGTRISLTGAPRLIFKNHYHVELSRADENPCPGFEDGYLYGPHVGLPQPENVQLTAHRGTWLKRRVQAAESLPAQEKCWLAEGTVLEIRGRTQLFAGNHYHVNLTGVLPCEGFENGYLWGGDIGIEAPQGVEYRVKADTWGKLRLADSSTLSNAEKCRLPADSAIVVPKSLSHAGQNHVLVEFRSFSECPFRTAYVYAPHLGLDFQERPVTPPSAPSRWGMAFSQHYTDNYGTIAATVGFRENACAAFATTALRSYGVDIPYIEWATTVADTLASMGWQRVSDYGKLLPGDLVFTRDAQTDVDGQATHVWVFTGYAPGYSSSIEAGFAIDNQGNLYHRALNNPANADSFWFAYRHP